MNVSSATCFTLEVFAILLITLLAGGTFFTTHEPGGLAAVSWVVAGMAILGLASLVVLHRRAGGVPLELGGVYLAVVLLYGLLPLIFFLILEGVYTPLNDARLFTIAPDNESVGRTGVYYLVYAATFVLAYLSVRGRRSIGRAQQLRPDKSTFYSVVVLLLMARSTLLLANMLFAADSTSYVESYTRFNQLPLIAQQLLGHLNGMSMVIGIAAIVAAAGSWRRYRYLVLLWLGVEGAMLVVGLGARTAFFVFCLALVISLHIRHRPFKMLTLALVGSAMVAVFLLFGFLRGGGAGEVGGPLVAIAQTASEFESLFANAIDLNRLRSNGELEGEAMWLAAYFGDFIALFPQQIIPFQKVNLSHWYVTTYYPEFAESGGGLAFGAIAEALLGNGVPDLLVRAAIVGITFGLIDRHYNRGIVTFWKCVFYVWIVCFCYQAFRSTTGALLPMFMFHFVPAYLGIRIFSGLLRGSIPK